MVSDEVLEKQIFHLIQELKSIITKNDRLSSALIMIIDGTDNKYPHPCSLDHEEINGIAREALGIKNND
jgi:hypothetical protein